MSSRSSSTIPSLTTNNVPSRGNQRRQNHPRRRQCTNRIYRVQLSPASFREMLIHLPPQTIDDPLIHQFFNGSPFY